MGDLAVDTALAPLAAPGEGRCFGAELSRVWEIWGPSGGYLAALAPRAAGACAVAIESPGLEHDLARMPDVPPPDALRSDTMGWPAARP